MSSLKQSISILFGGKPVKPNLNQISDESAKIYKEHGGKREKEFLAKIKEQKETTSKNNNWRKKRWTVLIFVNILFIISYVLEAKVRHAN